MRKAKIWSTLLYSKHRCKLPRLPFGAPVMVGASKLYGQRGCAMHAPTSRASARSASTDTWDDTHRPLAKCRGQLSVGRRLRHPRPRGAAEALAASVGPGWAPAGCMVRIFRGIRLLPLSRYTHKAHSCAVRAKSLEPISRNNSGAVDGGLRQPGSTSSKGKKSGTCGRISQVLRCFPINQHLAVPLRCPGLLWVRPFFFCAGPRARAGKERKSGITKDLRCFIQST